MTTGLIYEDLIPLRWSAVTLTLTEAQRARLQEANEEALRMIAALDEHPAETSNEHDAVAQELQRLDFKLNLVLDLVGQLLSQHLVLPAPMPVRLGSNSMEWDAADAPGVGGLVNVELFLSRKYPRAITLHGRVRQVDALEGVHRVEVIFEGVSALVQESLEKFIFRHHRRRIAHARRALGAEVQEQGPLP